MLKRFIREEEGATMFESGLMIALIAVVLILTVGGLGQALKTSFAKTKAGVDNANTAATAAGTATFP